MPPRMPSNNREWKPNNYPVKNEVTNDSGGVGGGGGDNNTDYGGGGNYGGGYQSTTYNAGGGAGSGGFFTGSQGGGGGGAGGSQGTPSKAFAKSSLRPVTIKQILDAHQPHQDSTIFMCDNTELSQVTFVGQVRNIVVQATNVTLTVDDGTGIMEVKQWLDIAKDGSGDDGSGGGAGASPAGNIQETMYVRILGNTREQNGRRHVGTHNIRPVTDYNEVLFHLLEATAIHLYFTKGPLEQLGGGGGGKADYGGDTHMADAGAGHGGGGGGGGVGGAPAGLNRQARMVFEVLKNSPSNEGLHINQIASKGGMNPADVYAGVEQLIELGTCFTTVVSRRKASS